VNLQEKIKSRNKSIPMLSMRRSNIFAIPETFATTFARVSGGGVLSPS
jgi:hypothetical protein